MIIDTASILASLSSYNNPKARLALLVKKGEYTRLKRGIYETDIHAPAHALAGAIYGPSYISFEWALSYYSLIPERVHTYTSASFLKSKTKMYHNAFGFYTYRDVPKTAYPHSLLLQKEMDYTWIIASPEKALLDTLYTKPPVQKIPEIQELLFDDLRIDETEFYKLNFNLLLELAPLYRRKTLKLFSLFISERGKE